MGLTQSVSASEVAQRTQVSIEEAEELLAAFTKHGGTGTHIGLDTFKQVLSDTQHLYDSPAFSPEAADLYFQIFDTTHDGLIDPYEFVVGCSIVATGEGRTGVQDDLSSYIDYMLNVGEKLFNQKALPLAPVRLGAAQEYKMRFKTMKKEIREEMLNKTFAVGSAGKVSREEWITAAKANNEAVNAFLHPYEPLQEIVDEAIAEIHRELGSKE
ncbi:uncharacterized protein ACA1_163660 [Acanthamoeba castellanii str. Neff]|uniref:EF-hand domain-containing protein n=1 Tax=Acanthamoeba castellanii (strain ATCC 30010 / Neff) TaxID=1257118 RepID=L8GSF1_ACACF|nr:uncharacterized protein ACA1_163660 [Acanthamoeba castellanii str. Neff]ELR15528.1 hypothetical protein ACA1_163660 [Acanthamoeba castellanii str. Neff]